MKNQRQEYAIGVDLGGTNLRVALVDRQGGVLGRKKGVTEAERGPEVVIRKIRALVMNMLRDQDLAIQEVRGVGVGTPGLLDPDKGEVYHAIQSLCKNSWRRPRWIWCGRHVYHGAAGDRLPGRPLTTANPDTHTNTDADAVSHADAHAHAHA